MNKRAGVRLRGLVCLLVVLATVVCGAKDKPAIVLTWPSEEKPVVRFTLGSFTRVSEYNGQTTYQADVTGENLWSKPLPEAGFSLDVLDKNGVRIGEGYLSLSHVAVGEKVKFKLTFSAMGSPAKLRLTAANVPHELQPMAPPKSVSMTVYTVPPGAALKVDGVESGVTPKEIHVTPGQHVLEFSKEGSRTAKYSFAVPADAISGGSVTYELGSAASDTIELRDGTTILGDLLSVTATEVVVQVGGKAQMFDRNQVKRLLLIEREPPKPLAQ